MRRQVLLPLVIACAVAACSDPNMAKQRHVQRGDRYVAETKLREAVIEYLNAIKIDPRFAAARLKLGDAYMGLQDAQSARGEYVRAADLLPTDIEAQLKAGQLHLIGRQFEEARRWADKALAIDAHSVEAQILKALALAGLRDLDGAMAQLEASIQTQPGHAATYLAMGSLQQAGGHVGLAEESFLHAVRSDPRSVEAHLALANLYWATKRTAETERALHGALAVSPRHVVANRLLAAFYMASGRREKAEAPLKAIAAAAPKAASDLALVDYYLSMKRLPEAEAMLERLAAQSDSFVPARLRQVNLAIARHDRTGAYRLLNEILRKESANIDALVTKADLELADGRSNEALATVRTALAKGGRLPRVHFLAGRIFLAQKDTRGALAAYSEAVRLAPRFVGAELELARLQLRVGKPDEASHWAQDALRLMPHDPEVRFVVAQAQLASGDLARAERSLLSLAGSYGELPALQTELGRLYLRKGDTAKARTAFERALRTYPADLAALEGLTTVDLRDRKVVAARSRIAAALVAAPNSDLLHLLAGRVYATTGDVDGAARSLKRAVTLNPGNLRAFAALAQLYTNQGRLPEATREFAQLVEKEPRSVALQTMLAMLLQFQGRSAEARARYEEILRINPRAAIAANNLAWMLAEEGQLLDTALQLAQVAKAALPDLPQVSDTLGWVYHKKGSSDRAIPLLQEAVEAEPQNASYHQHLGLAYAGIRDVRSARQSFERALALKPEARIADQTRTAMAALANIR